MGAYEKHNMLMREQIKDAFLKLLSDRPLADITVTELASRANVSRSTFYAHFAHTGEVFDSVFHDFACTQVTPLRERLRNKECMKCSSRRPFCEVIRDAGKYQPLVNDPRFFSMALQHFFEDEGGEGRIGDYLRFGLTPSQAKAIALFQLNGCYAVASSVDDDAAWADTQSVIDAFIRGGLQAVRSLGQAGGVDSPSR